MIRVRLTVNGKVEREVDVDRELVIGRKAPADLVVGDTQVSTRHATLRADGARLLVTDLGSTNGTRIDTGDRLAANQTVALERGQKLIIGPAMIEIVAARSDVESSGTFGKSEKTVAVGAGAIQELLVEVARFKASHAAFVLGAEHTRRTVQVTEMEVVVGRDSAEAQVVVPHQSVSSRHARLHFTGGKFLLEDLGSANGTFVSGARISGPTAIEPQTAVTFGTVDCLFVARAPEAGGAQGASDEHAEVLCAHAVVLGKATEQQSREALAEHRATARTLGEIFVEKGVFGPREWAEVYRLRTAIATLRPQAPSKTSSSKRLGLIVVLLGLAALAAFAVKLGWFAGVAK